MAKDVVITEFVRCADEVSANSLQDRVCPNCQTARPMMASGLRYQCNCGLYVFEKIDGLGIWFPITLWDAV